MFLLATIVFQIVTCYAIFAGFPQIPFGLKLVEEFIPYLFIQSFSKAIFEAYGRTWYMKIIPAGYDSQFFTLYQNAVGIGHSWSGSKWADFVFEQNGSIMVMNTFCNYVCVYKLCHAKTNDATITQISKRSCNRIALCRSCLADTEL